MTTACTANGSTANTPSTAAGEQEDESNGQAGTERERERCKERATYPGRGCNTWTQDFMKIGWTIWSSEDWSKWHTSNRSEQHQQRRKRGRERARDAKLIRVKADDGLWFIESLMLLLHLMPTSHHLSFDYTHSGHWEWTRVAARHI